MSMLVYIYDSTLLVRAQQVFTSKVFVNFWVSSTDWFLKIVIGIFSFFSLNVIEHYLSADGNFDSL